MITQEYIGDWYFPMHQKLIDIGKLLLKHNIKGKGDIHIKNHIEKANNYLLASSEDGKIWKYYIVDPIYDKINAVKDIKGIAPPY